MSISYDDNHYTTGTSVIPIVIGELGTVTKRTGTGTEGLRNKRTSGNHPNYSIVEIMDEILVVCVKIRVKPFY